MRIDALGTRSRELSVRFAPLEQLGGGSELREFGGNIAAFYELGIALDHLELGFRALAPETDVEFVLAEAEEIGQPVRQRRVDIELVARRGPAESPIAPESA